MKTDIPLLTDIRELRAATPEAKDYGNSDEVKNTYSAVAILVGGIFSRVIGSFFMKVNAPPYPTRIFTSKQEASSWLKKYIKD